MSELAHAKSFKELMVYKKARAIAKKIFEVSKNFPKEELYSLTDQVRRASRSIGAQIAEAWAKRRYSKHFISKLSASIRKYTNVFFIHDCGRSSLSTKS
jgi:hypothetical protein